jgi:hypothetical protein
VETTGSRVLTGGLDTLETIGKKTMEVLQEGDPGLKKKRALFADRTVLSQVLHVGVVHTTALLRHPHAVCVLWFFLSC